MENKIGNSKNNNFKKDMVMKTSVINSNEHKQNINLKTLKVFVISFILVFLALKMNAANYYWVGGSGNWTNASHWATTSGGSTLHATPPDSTDDVFFDANSFSQGDSIELPNVMSQISNSLCKNFTWTNTAPNIIIKRITYIVSFAMSGSVSLDSSCPVIAGIFFRSPNTGNTIKIANRIGSALFFEGGGSWIVMEDIGPPNYFTRMQSSPMITFFIIDGEVICNGKYVNVGLIHSGGPGTIDISNSFLATSGYLAVSGSSNSKVYYRSNVDESSTYNFSGNFDELEIGFDPIDDSLGYNWINSFGTNGISIHFNKLVFNGHYNPFLNRHFHPFTLTNGSYTNFWLEYPMNAIPALLMDIDSCESAVFDCPVTLSGQFDTLLFSANADTIYVDNITIRDSLSIISDPLTKCRLSVSPLSNSSGAINLNGGNFCLQNVEIDSINVTGSISFFAGSGCVDLGGNTGITFAPCSPTFAAYYWVGGSGNWSDVSHWATTSGGTTFHTTPPDSTSDVYFDANSFSAPNQTVTDTATALSYVSCRNLDFSGITFNSRLDMQWTGIKIYGSLAMTNKFTQLNVIEFRFEGNGSYTITNNNCVNNRPYRFYGGGTYTLSDSLSGSFQIEQYNGGLIILNGNYLSANLGPTTINIDLSGGVVEGSGLSINGSNPNGSRINVIGSTGGPSYLTGEFDELFIDPVIAAHWVNGNFSANKIFDIASNSASLFGNVVNCQQITFNGSADFNDSLYAQKVVTNGIITFSNSIIDTLLIGQQCSSVTIDNGSVVTINNLIAGNSVFSGKPLVKSSVNGVQAFIQKATGTVCLKNMQLRDIGFTGGAQFFADTSCVDLGGNSGIIFAQCNVVSDVWPGDANYDLIVNNIDLLNIGLAYNETGPVRSGASLTYIAQPASDWSNFFQSAVNKKHADTNGDGIVDDNDTTAIILNYGLTHPARIGQSHNPPSPNDPYLYLEVNPDSTGLSDTVYVETFYGTGQTPVDSVYGIAFSMSYDTALVANLMSTQFLNSWFGQPAVDLLTLQKSFPPEGRIDIAMVRTDHNNTSGFGGPLCRTGIVIVDNVAGRIPLPLVLSKPYAITAYEYELGVNLGNDTTFIDTASSTGISEFTYEHFNLSPNPANDFIMLKNISANAAIEIYNVQGQVVMKENNTGERNKLIDIRTLRKGIYNIRIYNENKILIGKLIKL